MTISCSSSFCPSTSAWTRTLVRSSVGFSRLAATIRRQRSKISGMSCSITPSTPSGLRSGSPGPERRVHQVGPDLVVLGRDPHEAADHAGDRRLGDVGDQVAGLAALERLEHVGDDRADLLLVGGDPLRREAGLEQSLDPVVLGRVHADEHRAAELDREAGVDRGDATELRRVGLPVAADRMDVFGRGHRPVARLLGVLADAARSSGRGSHGAARGTARAAALHPSSSRSMTHTFSRSSADLIGASILTADRRSLPGDRLILLLAGWPTFACSRSG